MSKDILKHVVLGDKLSVSQHNAIVDAIKAQQTGATAYANGDQFNTRNKPTRIITTPSSMQPIGPFRDLYLALVIENKQSPTEPYSVYDGTEYTTKMEPGPNGGIMCQIFMPAASDTLTMPYTVNANYWITPVNTPVEVGYIKSGSGTFRNYSLDPILEPGKVFWVQGEYKPLTESDNLGKWSNVQLNDPDNLASMPDGYRTKWTGNIVAGSNDGDVRPHPGSVYVVCIESTSNQQSNAWNLDLNLLSASSYINLPQNDDDIDDSWVMVLDGNNTLTGNSYINIRGDMKFSIEFTAPPPPGTDIFIIYQRESDWRYTAVQTFSTPVAPGTINAFYDTPNNNPKGWCYCDGHVSDTLHTPDLRSRFLVGFDDRVGGAIPAIGDAGYNAIGYTGGYRGHGYRADIGVNENNHLNHDTGTVQAGDYDNKTFLTPENTSPYIDHTNTDNRPPFATIQWMIKH